MKKEEGDKNKLLEVKNMIVKNNEWTGWKIKWIQVKSK